MSIRIPPGPRCVIIAGPNGAGKTTFAREFLRSAGDISHFINADLIASGLSPLVVSMSFLDRAISVDCLYIKRHGAKGPSFAKFSLRQAGFPDGGIPRLGARCHDMDIHA